MIRVICQFDYISVDISYISYHNFDIKCNKVDICKRNSLHFYSHNSKSYFIYKYTCVTCIFTYAYAGIVVYQTNRGNSLFISIVFIKKSNV